MTQLEEPALLEIVRSVMDDFLQMPVERVDIESSGWDHGRVVSGSVQITGGWNGVVLLYCADDLAQRAASVMFGRPVSEITNEHERDALGELVNITTGNVKALLPGPSRLSLPLVEHANRPPRLSGHRPIQLMGLTCQGMPLRLEVHEAGANARPS